MSEIRISADILQKIEQHGEQTFPEECIGAVLGKIGGDGVREVVDVIEFQNMAEENRRRRSLVAPQDFLHADRLARTRKLEVIGWYHSHPNEVAVPSGYDLENALPWYSYLIVSIRDGKAAELRSWRLAEDRSEFREEYVVASSNGG